MLCSIEIGTILGHKQSQAHYFIVANTLIEACAKAVKQVKKDYPDDSDDWTVIEATIKSVDDPVS